MASRSPGSLAALLLCQRLEQTPAAPLKSSEYWALLEAVGDPAALLGLDAATIASRFGTGTPLAERVATLLGAATGFALRLEEAEQQGLRVVASVDDGYPQALVDRLGRLAPPLLYLVGDPALLQADKLGIVGSREVGEEAAAVTRHAAAAAVEAGLGVVSGAAKGVDRLAMRAALDAGGTAVGVLADSLVRMTRDPEVRRAVTDGRLCLCTPYKPTAPFSIANAMGRNKLIYALSKATLVVAAGAETGGSWSGAVEAIRQATAPVLVWTGSGAGPGNPLLSRRGGIGVGRLADLFPLPEAPPPRAPRPVTDQLALEV
jgi:predicted Rossmann fold nucleotide-binding protein DprA/Smf involved in DNA uptake